MSENNRLPELRLFVSAATCASAVNMEWPCAIQDNAVNVFTCKIDTNAVTAASCLAAANVEFYFTAAGASSGSQLCQHQFSPTPTCTAGSVTGNTGNAACGCVSNQNGILTYQFNFLVDQSRKGGTLKCQVCVSPSNPFNDTGSSYNNIHIGGWCNLLGGPFHRQL